MWSGGIAALMPGFCIHGLAVHSHRSRQKEGRFGTRKVLAEFAGRLEGLGDEMLKFLNKTPIFSRALRKK
ncbi:transcriptional regulator, TetR family [Methylocaldum marinum]|uniref:Transcriptional regulator, TetR family n=1 Tax=Methylocaldum marinum TaxID=1432792 RepID=A0A250KRJ0_9GAMM|nr:transcriptional regulator, TetR family [Methylocaldum marinum]